MYTVTLTVYCMLALTEPRGRRSVSEEACMPCSLAAPASAYCKPGDHNVILPPVLGPEFFVASQVLCNCTK